MFGIVELQFTLKQSKVPIADFFSSSLIRHLVGRKKKHKKKTHTYRVGDKVRDRERECAKMVLFEKRITKKGKYASGR